MTKLVTQTLLTSTRMASGLATTLGAVTLTIISITHFSMDGSQAALDLVTCGG
jgi:hypothetical protein